MECKAMCYALRGAVTVDNDNPDEIIAAVRTMYEEILFLNNITEEEIAYIHFSQTRDLVSLNSATALRRSGYAEAVPLFCTEEAYTIGSLEKCIRVLILVNHPEYSPKKMVYMGRAKALRPDLGDKQ